MREIREVIFRGKRTDNGEWVEGGYIPLDVDSGYTYIIEPCNYASSLPVLDLIKLHSILVIPKTIGQFTGLTDKNGTKIFEGDILKSTIKIIDFNDDEGFSISHYDEELIGIVEWRRDGFMIAHKSGTWARCFYGCENYVIGNIHDNPELLQKI